MQNELTLKELILAVQDYFRYFLRKWYWFMLGALLVGGAFFYVAYTAPVSYTAPLTFLLNNSKQNSTGAGALLSGLSLGGGGADGTAPKLLELGKSRQVLGQVLFDSATVNGETKFVADHLIDAYGYHELWEESELLAGFYFNGVLPAKDDQTANRAFKSLHRLMTSKEEKLLTIDLDELSGLFSIVVQTPFPELSIAIAELTYEKLTSYFITASVSDKKESLDILKVRADSIYQELLSTESQLARFRDRTTRIPLQREGLRGQRLQRDALILGSMYAEVVKNRETAAFLLANEKPGFELVDGPLVPLSPRGVDWKVQAVIGVVFGMIIVVVVLFGVKLITDALKTE